MTTALERARSGDERAFGELVEPHRRELLVHCYRLLGSHTDAEDVLQETLLAAWRGLAGYEERAGLRTWLYRIATHRCLNARRDASRRPVEPVPPFPPPEPTRRSEVTWLQPWPEPAVEAVESVELAFVTALAHLPPRQAAALVLRDVLDFSTAEVAALLDTTPTVVKGLLQRARGGVRDQPRPAAAVERDLAARFAAAYVAGDVAGVVALLTDDAWLAMPPAPHEYGGRAAIAAFLAPSFVSRDREVELVPTSAAGGPAFGVYGGGRAAALIVLTCREDRIAAVTRFHLPELFARFGLPDQLRGASADIARQSSHGIAQS
ncbi:RNA polymerase subunit sigma-70 [Pseudonocardia sp. CA-107938]|uniref:RNA polymerase subunit sigma-70 n=1 Tax=Pseudonocardia sp. CA-107938 TaxID=3240021 RepID=UPI003D90210E